MIKLPAEIDPCISGADNRCRSLDSRSRDSFNFAAEIVKPWGGLEPILAWCREELADDWRWQLVTMSTDKTPGQYKFYFDSERDYLAFVLKWS